MVQAFSIGHARRGKDSAQLLTLAHRYKWG